MIIRDVEQQATQLLVGRAYSESCVNISNCETLVAEEVSLNMLALRTVSCLRASNLSSAPKRFGKSMRNLSTQPTSRNVSQRSVGATLFFGSLCLVTASLGYWQAGR